MFYHNFSFFQFPKNEIFFLQITINCIQYDRVLKIFYFHILNVAKFWLKILMDDLSLEQHYKIEKIKNKK